MDFFDRLKCRPEQGGAFMRALCRNVRFCSEFGSGNGNSRCSKGRNFANYGLLKYVNVCFVDKVEFCRIGFYFVEQKLDNLT